MLSSKQKSKLFKLSSLLNKIAKNLTLTTVDLTPINYQAEEDKFLNSSTYNPVFDYNLRKAKDVTDLVVELKADLIKLDIPKDLIDYIKLCINDIDFRFQTRHNIGKIKFPVYAEKLFAWELPDLKSIEKVLNLDKFEPEDNNVLFTASQIKQEFLKQLKILAINDIKVELDSFNPVMVRVSQDGITIGSRIRRNKQNVNRLLIHEIQSHIFQRINIKKSKNPLYKMQVFSEWLLYSEGMAVFNEIQSNTITKTAYDSYRLRYIAVLNRHKSFREIYNLLAKETSNKKAYLTAYRVKRGMHDTSLPGGYPKDALYLLGAFKIKKFIESGKDYKLLYHCRIPRLAKLLRKYDLLSKTPILIPKNIVI